jgi:hypothetical protein
MLLSVKVLLVVALAAAVNAEVDTWGQVCRNCLFIRSLETDSFFQCGGIGCVVSIS